MNNEITKFLFDNYSKKVSAVEFVAKGMFSSAYIFLDGNEEKIIRLNVDKKDFLKDKYAEKFSCNTFKVPRVLEIGEFNDKYFYAISERCIGETFDKLTLDKKRHLTPKVTNALLAIHNTDITSCSGYGDVDVRFNGVFYTWKQSILNKENHKIPYKWMQIFEREFFEVELFDRYKYEMEKLLHYIPEVRYLVHGDFGFDNLIIDGDKIAGVIDWAEAKIGDFIYDIAWLDFWSADIRYSIEMKNMYSEHQMDLSNYKERLNCYILQIGLSSMVISSHFNNKNNYAYAVSRINFLIN